MPGSGAPASASGDAPPPPPPGIGRQAKTTRDAAFRFISAHINLAKAEFGEIADKAKAAAAKAAVAIGCVIYMGLLVPAGLSLFMGEWIFGSLGWGLLHGVLASVAMIVIMGLAALEIPSGKLAGAFVFALFWGIVVAVGLGLALPNKGYAALGEQVFPGIDAGVRPLLAGVALLALVFAVLGLLLGLVKGGFGGLIAGFFGGAFLGALVGAVTAISYTVRPGVALGLTVLLMLWPVMAALNLRGYDWEALKNGYTPRATIDTTKESIEWVRGLTKRSPKP